MITTLATKPGDAAIVLAGTEAGAFRSTTAAGSWQRVASLPDLQVSLIVFDPAVASRAFAATKGAGIWISNDSGATWIATSSGLPSHQLGDPSEDSWTFEPVGALAIDPSNHANLYAAVRDAGTYSVYKSTDGGASWSATASLAQSVQSLAVGPTGIVWAGNGDGIFKSVNAGASWTPAASGLPASPFPWAILTDPANASIVYAGITSDASSGVWKTTDGGASWGAASSLGGGGTFTASFALALIGGDLFSGGISHVYRSANAAASWTDSSSGLTGMFYGTFAGSGTTLYAGNNASLFKSTDGGSTWTEASTGLRAGHVDAIVRDPSTGYLYAAYWDRIFRSTDDGVTWARYGTGIDGFVFQSLQFSGGNLLAALVSATCRGVEGNTGYFAKSTNGGSTWTTPLMIGTAGGLAQDVGFKTLLVDPSSANHFYAAPLGQDALFHSVDGGATWNVLFDASAVGTTLAAPMAIDPVNPLVLYFGTAGGVYRSPDKGSTWSQVLSLPNVFAIDVDPSNHDRVYVGTDSGIYRSDNGGTTFNPVANDIADGQTVGSYYPLIRGFAFDPKLPGAVYVATDQMGVFFSVDGGGTPWTQINDGLDVIHTSTIVATPNAIYTGTAGGGLYRRLAQDLTPTIAGFTPSSGEAGTSVTITGTNLSGATVTFTGASAVSSTGSSTSIIAVVPSAARPGPITVTTTYGSATSSTSFVVPSKVSTVHGDANSDGVVTAADVIYLANYLFAGGQAPIGPTDVNADGVVTTADLFYLVNFVFGGGAAPR